GETRAPRELYFPGRTDRTGLWLVTLQRSDIFVSAGALHLAKSQQVFTGESACSDWLCIWNPPPLESQLGLPALCDDASRPGRDPRARYEPGSEERASLELREEE